jgi:hypothetical protein
MGGVMYLLKRVLDIANFDVLSQRVIDLTQQIDSICAKIRSVLVYHTVEEYPPHLDL